MIAADRWTVTGEPQAEDRVREDVAQITEAVTAALGDRLVALVLVGSYARGEGGVVLSDRGPRAFNDYDWLCVFDARPTAGERSALRALGALLEERRGVSVDLWPITRAQIAGAQKTLFWLDIAMGGARVLYGDASVLDPVRAMRERDVSLDEAGRLLANRAAGVALSRLALRAEQRQPPMSESALSAHGASRWAEPLVLLRHTHKAVLACGDALLLATRRYASTLRERSAELERMCAGDAALGRLPASYREAMAFRVDALRWRPAHGQSVSEWNTEVLALVSIWHLRFERWRAGTPESAVEYARWRPALYPSSADAQRPSAMIAGALSAWRRRAIVAPWRLRMHPREQLARAVVGVAYAPESALDAVCWSTLGVGEHRALEPLEQLVQSAG
ncbi:MAG: nucleotidyltransferase domain-containing protein [Polyangiales bacterium]